MADALDTYKKTYQDGIAFIEKCQTKLPEEELKEYARVLKGLKEASGMAKDEESWSYLAFATVRQARTIAFKMFDLEELNGDLEKEYRALPTPQEAVKVPKAFNDEHMKESEDLTKKQQAFAEAAQKRELFQAVCTGMPLKEAKQKLEAYNQRVAESMQGR